MKNLHTHSINSALFLICFLVPCVCFAGSSSSTSPGQNSDFSGHMQSGEETGSHMLISADPCNRNIAITLNDGSLLSGTTGLKDTTTPNPKCDADLAIENPNPGNPINCTNDCEFTLNQGATRVRGFYFQCECNGQDYYVYARDIGNIENPNAPYNFLIKENGYTKKAFILDYPTDIINTVKGYLGQLQIVKITMN